MDQKLSAAMHGLYNHVNEHPIFVTTAVIIGSSYVLYQVTRRNKKQHVVSQASMSNAEKTVIVTGGNQGIGFVAARRLCEKGYSVILGCRSEDRAKEAITTLQKQVPGCNVQYIKVDVSEPDSVQCFAVEFEKLDRSLYCLVNNAGISMNFASTERKLNSKGWEMTMATNHMGPYLLTQILLPSLKQAVKQHGEARIVNVASSMHDKETATKSGRGAIAVRPLDPADLMMTEGYSGLQAYKDSKLANIFTTYSMARTLEASGVTINCLCPGFIPTTGLSRDANFMSRMVLRYVLGGVLKSRMKGVVVDVEDGGAAVEHLVTAEEHKGQSGNYFKNGEKSESSEESRDTELQERFIASTENLLGLQEENVDIKL